MTEQAIRDEDIIRTEEGLIFNPYNNLNTEIKLNDVQSILTTYGIPPIIHNMELYRRAFIHRSYTKRPDFENLQQKIKIVERPDDCLPLSTKSNERLEFLGDGILECVAKYVLYRRFPKCNEGFMTEKKIAIVKNEAIGKIALEMGLHKWLILSRNAEEKKTRTNLKKLGCLFESFIGALFLDFNKIIVKDEEGWFQDMFITGPGFQMAQKFIERIDKQTIYSAMFSVNYFKGFSIMRSNNLEETAMIACNMVYKLVSGLKAGKQGFYNNIKIFDELNSNDTSSNEKSSTNNVETKEPTEKDYCSVIKKIKKENVTPENIGEIMLCQIPGVSSVSALAILNQFKTLPNLIKSIQEDETCLNNIFTTDANGKNRKISKTAIATIIKFLKV